MKALLALAVLAVLLSALTLGYERWTAPPQREKPPLGETPNLPLGAVLTEGPLPRTAWRQAQRERLASQFSRPPQEVLVLSSGGARGAFGAGILTGWTQTGERPRFDVVTGASVGSLLAVFAFLGSEYDDRLEALFARRHELSDFSWLERQEGGVMSVEPFRRSLAEYYDSVVVEAVAERHRQGARLYVGTSDLDSGELTIWDMGLIATSGRPDAAEHFRSVLLASCSMPLLFPPVMLDFQAEGRTYQQMHVDGGLRSPVFLPIFVSDTMKPHGRVYLIVNHSLSARLAHQPVENSLPAVGFASFKVLLDDKLFLSVSDLVERCLLQELTLKLLAEPVEFGGDTFALRPEDAAGDPAKLFEQSQRLILETPWSQIPKMTEELQR